LGGTATHSEVVRGTLATTAASRAGRAIGSALFLGMVLTALGSPLIYRGWQRRKTYRELIDLPTTFSAAKERGGIIQVSGRVKDTEATVSSPIQSARCELAFWKAATLRRYDTLNHMSYWSVIGLGVDGETLTVSGEQGAVKVSDLDRKETLDASEKIHHLLKSNGNTVLDSVLTELDPPDFEERRLPSEEWDQRHVELGDRIGEDPKTTSSPGILGKILNAIRTPEGTVQFQETTVNAGDTVTVIGTVVSGQDKCVRLQGTESIDPAITRCSPSEWAQKHRRAYRIQLYAIPTLIMAITSLAGIGVFL
jgi:hypothetical protein